MLINKIQEWWSIYKQDLIFNIMMTILVGMLYILTLLFMTWAIKDIIEKF